MAPTEDHVITARQSYRCPNGYYYSGGYCYRSGWNSYGRWILAAAVIVFFFVVFFLWACINARRRRKRGLAPRYGTGWIAPGGKWNGPPPNNNQGYYNPQGQPPPYNPQNGPAYPMQNQNTGGNPEGYYGVPPPKNAYYPGNPGNGNYEPPPGPPPNHVVR